MQAGEVPTENAFSRVLAETCKSMDKVWKGLPGAGRSFERADGMDKA